jgi:hypothetical protein
MNTEENTKDCKGNVVAVRHLIRRFSPNTHRICYQRYKANAGKGPVLSTLGDRL